MFIIQLLDGLATQDSILILSALGIAYLLGIFSMQGYMYYLRKKNQQQAEELKSTKQKLAKAKTTANTGTTSRIDILAEPIQEYMNDEKNRFALLQQEFNSFKNDFQDSIEFYVHSIEELSESNHSLARKVKALELENEQLIKAVWSDDLSFKSFAQDVAQPHSTNDQLTQESFLEETKVFIKDDAALEATKNIENWINAQKKKNHSQDDLSKIKGISKAIEEKINAIGITSYAQLSLLDDALIDDLAKAINYFSGRIKKEDWIGQAYQLGKTQK